MTLLSRKKWILLACISGSILFVVGLGWVIPLNGASPAPHLFMIVDAESDEIYVQNEVETGDQVQVSWLHSVEHTPWHEWFTVNEDGTLTLTKTKFKSFGAGVPHDHDGQVEVKGDYVQMTGLNQKVDTYSWIHSHDAAYTIKVNGQTVLHPEDVAHHQQLNMLIEKR